VAYVSNNQLLTVNADGGNRSMIVDGGAVDQNAPYLNSVNSPVFSPNGQTIAYAHKGLNFYSVIAGRSNRVLEDAIDDMGNGLLIPSEMFIPEQYTADGGKLMLTLGYYEGASAAIYYPSSSALVRLSGVQDAMICCGETSWTADGSMFYAANPTAGMTSAGLWRVDATTGNVTTLLSGNYDAYPADAADEPFPAPDGNLYFFYASIANADEFNNRPKLQLVRSKMDGVTDRTVLRSETYEYMNESLWAPDGSFVIVAIAQTPDSYPGGAAQLVYTDGNKAVIPLIPYVNDMKWGP
jgi:Tol biopolymer transport system component